MTQKSVRFFMIFKGNEQVKLQTPEKGKESKHIFIKQMLQNSTTFQECIYGNSQSEGY